MRTIVFSDTHLEKNFDSKKFTFLKNIIEDTDRIIIAGDFWEGSLLSLDEFLASEWQQLFSLLATKETIYIIGNHDKELRKTKRKLFFANVYPEKYIFQHMGKNFIVQHGHQYPLSFHTLFGGKVDLNKSFKNPAQMVQKYIIIESFLTRTFGTHVLQRLYKKFNRELKKFLLLEQRNEDFFIFGHTHAAELDIKNNFANTGFVRHGLGQYILITDDTISLQQTWYDKPTGIVPSLFLQK